MEKKKNGLTKTQKIILPLVTIVMFIWPQLGTYKNKHFPSILGQYFVLQKVGLLLAFLAFVVLFFSFWVYNTEK